MECTIGCPLCLVCGWVASLGESRAVKQSSEAIAGGLLQGPHYYPTTHKNPTQIRGYCAKPPT